MPLPQPPKISFCTTCMGRLEHLKQTLPQNIKDNADYPNAQFVVVNYGGERDTEEWVRANFKREMESGKLKYVSYPEAAHFKFPHAKNLAHRMADGDILCNVDADQFIGKGFAHYVAEAFTTAEKRGRSVYMRHNPVEVAREGNTHKSSLGKIAILKKDYDKLRGYNEKLAGWGGDDTDLNARMMMGRMGNAPIPLSFANGIEHSDELRNANMDEEGRKSGEHHLKQAAQEHGGWRSVAGKAKRMVGHMARAALSGANNPEGYGQGEVYVNLSETPTRLSRNGINELPPVEEQAPSPTHPAVFSRY